LSTLSRLASNALTALLIAFYFTPIIQGYFYTFANLLALQVLVELGISQVIIQFSSHEWAHLRLTATGHIAGDADAFSRLVSLGRIAGAWYAVLAIIVALGLSVAGSCFFLKSPGSVHWAGPWLLLSALTGASLVLVPLWAILEGCNFVAEVY